MAEYYDLGARPPQPKPGAADPFNVYAANNWTVTFAPQDLNCKVSLAEIYHITLDGPVGSSFKVFRNKQWWDTVLQGWSNSWDPQQPLYIRKDDSVFFYWNSAANPAPVVTVWMRYDTALRQNQDRPMAGGQ